MPIPADKANIVSVCDHLMDQGHTSAFSAHDLQDLSGRYVTKNMMRIMLEDGLLQECRKGFYLKVERYLQWKSDYENRGFGA